MESIHHHDFKRLWALRNRVGKTEHLQFLVQGGRQIKDALDEEYPLLEIWVAAQAMQNLAWLEDGTSNIGVPVKVITQELLKKL